MGGCQSYDSFLGTRKNGCRGSNRDHNFDNQPYMGIYYLAFRVSQKQGYRGGGSQYEDSRILGSVLGPPYFGKGPKSSKSCVRAQSKIST